MIKVAQRLVTWRLHRSQWVSHVTAQSIRLQSEKAALTHGGMGYAAEYYVERLFREYLGSRIVPASREMIWNHISEKVLELPRSY
jgi:acyl-CoA dehydrogenase